jgi:hypothetical protein
MSRQPRRPKTRPTPATLTPEEVKARIDALDWVGQSRLWQLLLSDPNSQIGQKALAMMSCLEQHITWLERKAEATPEFTDPEELLARRETAKQAARRLKKPTANAARQARHRARKRRATYAPPPFSAPTGPGGGVTPVP